MPTPGGMFLEEVDLAAFDAAFFNISRADAISMDPQQRLLLEVVYECLENSGLKLETLRGGNVGCIVGAIGCGMFLPRQSPARFEVGWGSLANMEYLDYEAGSLRDPEDQVPGTSTGHSRSILSNRVSHFLDINGPR